MTAPARLPSPSDSEADHDGDDEDDDTDVSDFALSDESDEERARPRGGEEQRRRPQANASARSQAVHPSEWGVDVTVNNMRVGVQYSVDGHSNGGGSASNHPNSARDRARLFPHGLHGTDSLEPGASVSYSSKGDAAQLYGGSSRWDAHYSVDEDDAKRMARVARIMAEDV
jgi:hypothetical protein